MGKRQPSVIVVGSGIIGAAIAWRLAERGAEVTVVEGRAPATGATANSFAWINAQSPETPAYFALRLAAIAEHRVLNDRFGDSASARWVGSLAWDQTRDNLAQQARELSDLGHRAELIGANETARLEPNLVEVPEVALYCPDEAMVEPTVLTRAMVQAAVDAGTRVVTGADVASVKTTADGTRVVGVSTAVGEIAADHVVIAAGTGTAPLLSSAGVALPTANRIGMLIHTEPVDPIVSRVLLSPTVHVRQELDGRLIVGEDFSGTFAQTSAQLDTQVDAKTGDQTARRPDRWSAPLAIAEELLDDLPKVLRLREPPKIGALHFGERPVPGDGHPVIGSVDTLSGLTVAMMHSGITLAPLVGKLVAAEILGDAPQPLLSAFRPSRFQALHRA
ncbi:MAG: FAD-dependent oxidoreductase [Pseudomonadota bacterium]